VTHFTLERIYAIVHCLEDQAEEGKQLQTDSKCFKKWRRIDTVNLPKLNNYSVKEIIKLEGESRFCFALPSY
jgi:hypothetical protein